MEHISGYKLYLTRACRFSLQETRNLSNSLEKQTKLGIPHTLQESMWENTWENKQKAMEILFGKAKQIIEEKIMGFDQKIAQLYCATICDSFLEPNGFY